ncbi:VOC family protein [Streptomyces sp. NBC_01591]|uniref:VOC family protein n=1 Tax=Streptomyces sp. NBC_01591 TaxID=2975888 RepID=UPI002DDB9F5D|nr:VOC family protein [Streptomyces sp. NBC_01591]
MSRVQLALRVPDLPASIAFYSKLPRHRAGQTARRLRQTSPSPTPPLKLVLVQGPPDEEARMDHLGVEVDTTEAVRASATRLADQGLATDIENGRRPPPSGMPSSSCSWPTSSPGPRIGS